MGQTRLISAGSHRNRPVLATYMKCELAKKAAIGVPTISAYNPCTGLRPASSADAMPSGIATSAVVTPALASRRQRLKFTNVMLYPLQQELILLRFLETQLTLG
jgi:hypothetical protein